MTERRRTMEVDHPTARAIAVLFAIAALFVVTTFPAEGAQHRCLLEWSGQSQGNRAVAMGFILIDDQFLNNPGSNGFPAAPFIKDFQVVVSKATNSSHNSTFDAGDFGGISLDFAGGGGELTREVVGQSEFLGLDLASRNVNAPKSISANAIRTGGGSGDVLVLTSFRPLVSTSVRVYKCTFSAKAIYNYGDEDLSGSGVYQWVSRSYSARASYYLILDPASNLMSFIWVDTKLKQFQQLVDCTLPEIKGFQRRVPSIGNPAGDWELAIPLWSHREDIDIDPISGTPDASRSRSLCLIGLESLTTFRLPVSGTSVRDLCAPSLTGKFCQLTNYNDRHYAFPGSTTTSALTWADPVRDGGGLACVTGILSCRLDTNFTSKAIEDGDGLVDGENAVVDDLLGKGWVAQPDVDYSGGPLGLQPTGGEVLELLIP